MLNDSMANPHHARKLKKPRPHKIYANRRENLYPDLRVDFSIEWISDACMINNQIQEENMKKLLVLAISLFSIAAFVTVSSAQRGKHKHDPACVQKCKEAKTECEKDPSKNVKKKGMKMTPCEGNYSSCYLACPKV